MQTVQRPEIQHWTAYPTILRSFNQSQQ